MPQFTAVNDKTGESVDFEWYGDQPPTDADIDAILREASQGQKPDAAAEPEPSPQPEDEGGWGPFVSFKEMRRRLEPENLKEQLYKTSPLPLFEKENLPSTAAGIVGGTAAALSGGLLLPVVASALAGGGTRGAVSLAEGKGLGDAATDAATTGALEGAMSAIPAVGGGVVKLAGRAAEKLAPKFILSGLKPVHSYISRRAAIEGNPLIETAEDIAGFINREQLGTPQAARKVIEETGEEVNQLTAKAAREGRMGELSKNIRKRLAPVLERIERFDFPRADRNAAHGRVRELIADSPLSERRLPVPTAGNEPPLDDALASTLRELSADPNWPGPINMTGRPTPTPRPPTMPRPDVAPSQFVGEGATYRAGYLDELKNAHLGDRQIKEHIELPELLELIREKSVFDPAAPKGVSAVDKAVELGKRDAFKEAVPKSIDVLKRQGRAMDSERLLDRAAWREANRDMLGLGPTAGILSAILTGNLPLGTAMALGLGAIKSRAIPIGLAMGKRGPQMQRVGKGTIRPEYLTEALRAMLQSGGVYKSEPPPEQ